MYIEPNSTIMICKNVPLDPTYDHTIWFDAQDDQYIYFSKKRKFELNKQSYQRTQRGYMRVRIKAEDLYDCNYIMYRNNSFGTKWFYAFLVSVEYINNEVSEIHFQIDVMQTWWFDYYLEQCFVEREHSRTDYIGGNVIEENLGAGPTINVEDPYFSTMFRNNNYYYVIATTQVKEDNAWSSADGRVVNSMYNGVKFIVYENAEDINHDLKIFTDDQKSDCIVAIFMIPSALITLVGDGSYNANTYGPQTLDLLFGTTVEDPTSTSKPIFPYINQSGSLNFYTPRNNKLYTHPFSYITIVSSDGDNQEYKRESFDDPSHIRFKLDASLNPNPEYSCYPKNYNRVINNMLESVHINSSPQCAYTIDGYRAWLAQRKYTLPTQYITAGASILAGLAKIPIEPNYIGPPTKEEAASRKSGSGNGALIGGGVAAIANLFASQMQAKRLPDSLHNSQTNALSIANEWFGFHAYSSTISGEYAEIIDDFFDRFGYACRRNKIPERHARHSWTYTKTINCTIRGSIPADDAVKICSIYDHGITFWVNGRIVGDYTQENTPLDGGD